MCSLYRSYSPAAVYMAEENLIVRRVGDKNVVINPENGAWSTGSLRELATLLRGKSLPDELGRWAEKRGLARRSGGRVVTPFIPFTDLNQLFITYNITSACNLDCIYCFANAGGGESGSVMAKSELSHGIVDAVKIFYDEKAWSITLMFCGGEPLLNYAQIRETVLYAEKRYPNLPIRWVVQTNLTLLRDEYISFFREHHVQVSISIDGFEQMHDAQRHDRIGNGSFSKVSQNIRKILAVPGVSTGLATAVVSSYYVKDLSRAASSLIDLGFENLSLQPVMPVGRGNDDLVPDAKEYAECLFRCFSEVFIPYYRTTGKMVKERQLSLTLSYLIEPARYNGCEQTPCIGARNMLAISSQGEVYPCNQAITISEFSLGNIGKYSLNELLHSIRATEFQGRTVNSVPECLSCEYRGWCQSPCPISAWVKHGHINAPSGYCDFMKARMDCALDGYVNGKFDLEAVIAAKSGMAVSMEDI